MKAILSLWRHSYLKTIGTFLIAVVLIAGVVGCVPPETYDLTMAVAPAGGGTATDVTATSPYASGTAVSIQAVPAAGYQFVIWTAPAGTFADPNAATTTFTMPAQDVTVTANFVGVLDHFKGYGVDEATAPSLEQVVYLEDQFVTLNATVEKAELFCNPVEKLHNDVLTKISNPDHHLTLYGISYEEEPQIRLVEVNNQFGTQNLTVWGPVLLAVPTQKLEPGSHEAPLRLDHYLLYEVHEGPPVETAVGLWDQFGDEDALVYEPVFLANPVRKGHSGAAVTEIVNPEDHLVFYYIEGQPFQTQVQVVNQFGDQTLDLSYPELLAVPSQKSELEPLVDHFKTYYAEGIPIGADVYLEDQFNAAGVEAHVTSPTFFCNPVEKWHGDVPTPIWNADNHLTLYNIFHEAPPQLWRVEVDNQFGTQELYVSNPVLLAVPTQKGSHGPPVDLDHFLLYEVIAAEPVDAVVDLHDQFHDEQEVLVTVPVFFANPVQKTHPGGTGTPIKNPEAHLVFYEILEGGHFETQVLVDNQFGPQELGVYDPCYLAVPSVKLFAEPAPG